MTALAIVTNNLPEIPLRDANAHIVVDVVSRAYMLSPNMLTGERRSKRIAEARMLAMWLVMAKSDLGISGTAELFNKDHSSCYYACKRMAQLRTTDASFRSFSDRLIAAVEARIG